MTSDFIDSPKPLLPFYHISHFSSHVYFSISPNQFPINPPIAAEPAFAPAPNIAAPPSRLGMDFRKLPCCLYISRKIPRGPASMRVGSLGSPLDVSHAQDGWDCSDWCVPLLISFDPLRSSFGGFAHVGLDVGLDVGRCGHVSGRNGC
jgi:hypothetical protein